MTSKILTLAATALSVAWLCAAPVMPAQAAETAVAVVTDPARLAIENEIITNMHMVDVFIFGAKRGLLEDKDVAAWPQSKKDRLIGLLDAAVVKHRATLTRDFAAANLDSLTMDQVNNLLTLSKIKYFQQVIQAVADPSIHPDASSMTAEERAFVDKIANADYADNFLSNMDPGKATDELKALLQEALQGFDFNSPT